MSTSVLDSAAAEKHQNEKEGWKALASRPYGGSPHRRLTMRQPRIGHPLPLLAFLIFANALHIAAAQGRGNEESCTDKPPDDARTCPELALLGFCSDPFIVQNGLCLKTCGKCENPPPPKPKKQNRTRASRPACSTVLDVVDSHPMLSILRTALMVTGMDEELSDPSAKITLLAPTDDAFLAFFRDHEISERIFLADVPNLVKILNRHILSAPPSKTRKESKNLSGELVRIKQKKDKTYFCLESGTDVHSEQSVLLACKSAVYVVNSVLESDHEHGAGFMVKDSKPVARKEGLKRGPWGAPGPSYLNSISATRQTSLEPPTGGSHPCGGPSHNDLGDDDILELLSLLEPAPEDELDLDEEMLLEDIPDSIPLRGDLGSRAKASVPTPGREAGQPAIPPREKTKPKSRASSGRTRTPTNPPSPSPLPSPSPIPPPVFMPSPSPSPVPSPSPFPSPPPPPRTPNLRSGNLTALALQTLRDALFPSESGNPTPADGCDPSHSYKQNPQESPSPSPQPWPSPSPSPWPSPSPPPPSPSQHQESISALRSGFLAGTPSNPAPPPPQIQSQTGHRPVQQASGVSALRDALLRSVG